MSMQAYIQVQRATQHVWSLQVTLDCWHWSCIVYIPPAQTNLTTHVIRTIRSECALWTPLSDASRTYASGMCTPRLRRTTWHKRLCSKAWLHYRHHFTQMLNKHPMPYWDYWRRLSCALRCTLSQYRRLSFATLLQTCLPRHLGNPSMASAQNGWLESTCRLVATPS